MSTADKNKACSDYLSLGCKKTKPKNNQKTAVVKTQNLTWRLMGVKGGDGGGVEHGGGGGAGGFSAESLVYE